MLVADDETRVLAGGYADGDDQSCSDTLKCNILHRIIPAPFLNVCRDLYSAGWRCRVKRRVIQREYVTIYKDYNVPKAICLFLFHSINKCSCSNMISL